MWRVRCDVHNIFGALSSIRHSSIDRCPSMKRNELLRPSSLLYRSHLSCFWLSSSFTPESFPTFSHSLSTGAFAAHGLRQRKNVCPKMKCCDELSPFPAMWSSWWSQGQWNRYLAIFVRYPDGAFHWTTFASPTAWRASPLTSRALAIDNLAWM